MKLRRLFVIFFSLLLLPLALLLLVFALLQLDPVRVQLLTWGQRALQGQGINIQLEGLHGYLPINFGLERLSLADEQGIWLELEGLRLAWRPMALLQGRVHVEELSLRRFALERLPPSQGKTEASPVEKPTSGPIELRLPEGLPLIQVDRLALSSIALGAPVLGEAIQLGLAGEVSAGSKEGARARLELRRLDQETAKVALLAKLAPDQILEVNLEAGESGGLVKRLAKLPLTGPLSLQLHGRGAITDWPGELKLILPGMLELATSLHLAMGETRDFSLEGTLSPAAGLVEPKIAALIGQVIPFALGVQLVGSQRPVLRKLQLETAVAKLEGRAEADLEAGNLTLDMAVQIADLARLRPLIGRPVAGSARLRLHGDGELKSPKLRLTLEGEGRNADKLSLAELAARVEADLGANRLGLDVGLKIADLARLQPLIGQPLGGSARLKLLGDGELRQPKLQLTLEGEGVNTGKLRLAELATQVKARFFGALDTGFPGVGLDIQGRIKGLETGADVPADSLTWKGEIRVPATGPIEIPRFELAGGNVGLDLSGKLNPQTLDGSLDLRADIADLAPWAGMAGAKVSGGVSLNAQAEIAQGDSSGGARLEIKTRKLNGLPPAAGGLLGPEVELKAIAKLKDKRQLRLESLKLNGKELDLTAEGDIPLGEGQLALRSRLSLPRLEVLNKGAGIPLAGALIADLNLDGPRQNPRARLELQGQRLKYDGRDLQQLQARINADQLTHEPKGELDIRLGPQTQALGLSAAFEQRGAELAIRDLRLSAPATRLQGQFKLDTKQALVQGELRGRAEDLGALSFWSGRKDLQGALDLVVALAAPKTQQVNLRLKGSGLGGDFGRLDELKADLALADAQAVSGLDLHLEAKGIAQGEHRLQSVTVTAKGDLQRLDLSTRVAAERPQDTRLDLNAQLQQVGQDKRLLVQHLTGAWQGRPFSLKAPVELTAGAKELRLGHLGLEFAGAALSAEGRLGARDLSAEVVLDPLPLKLLADLGLAEIEGTAKAKVNLGGTKAQPQVRLEVDVRDLKGLTAEAKKLPPARVTAKAELVSGQLTADLGIAGLTDKPARLNVAVPLRLAIEPFDFHLDERSPLQGSFDADADIGRLSRFLSLDEQKLAGVLQAAIRLGGSLGNPELGGAVRLQRGLYENGLSGTLIKDLELEILLSGQSARITRLSANDGGVGRIDAKGGLTLDRQGGGFRLDTELNLAQATLVRSDDASATLSGHLAVSGDQRGAQAKGNLSVEKAEIRIPERVGPEVPKLEVRETPSRAKGGKEPAKSTKAPLYPVNLDIKVDIPSRTFVRGRGLDSEWRGNLEIAGQAQEPRITGQLRVQRGIFDFLDRRFKIQEGSIDFYGGTPPIPNINLKADAAGRDMLAILSVTGSALNPKLTLESEPTLPQDEVLARLLFDRSVKDISPLQALKLAAAVRTLTGGGRGIDFLGKARDSLGLDTLDMGGAGAESKSVKAGKYLREDVYLEVESGLGSGAGKVRVEKEISRQLSVETSVDQDSSSAFGINWKVDY